MAQTAPAPACPVTMGDILSFDTHPGRAEDLVECTVDWQQVMKDRSEKYMVFKVKNVTAGDTDFAVPVFVQKTYCEKDFGNASEFTIMEKWQHGQRNAVGADRFVVLHNQEYLGDPLHSYNSLVVWSLVIPSELNPYASGNPKTIQ